MRRFVDSAGGRRAFHQESGGALVMALLVVIVVAGLAASFMQFSSAINRRQIGAIDKKKSFYMAEAGLSEAFVGLRVGKTGAVGSPEAPAAFGDGLFWVDATDVGEDMVQLESTGMVGSGAAMLSIVAQRGRVSVASLGVFAAEGLVLKPGTVIDGYDSSDGTYEEVAASDPDALTVGRLGSNGQVSLTGTVAEPTVVRGDVMPGPEESASIVGAVTITGNSDPLAAPIELPPVIAPTYDPIADVAAIGAVPTIVSGTKAHIPVLRVEDGAQAIIQGPVSLTVGQFLVRNGGEILFDSTDGPIEIYVTEGMTVAPGANLSYSREDTTGLSIQVSGETATAVTLEADTRFYGVFYAPESDVQVGGEFEIYGSIIGKSLVFADSCRVHFDMLLASEAVNETLPEYLSWRIIELETTGEIGVSPEDRLGITVADCERPSDAHADQMLELTYVDQTGAIQTFNDLESNFAWNNVDFVITGRRDGEYFGMAAATNDGSETAAAYDFGAGMVPR